MEYLYPGFFLGRYLGDLHTNFHRSTPWRKFATFATPLMCSEAEFLVKKFNLCDRRKMEVNYNIFGCRIWELSGKIAVCGVTLS